MGVRAMGQRLVGMVTVLERFPLGPKQSLLVVKAGQEVLLLGLGEGQVSLLTKLDPKEVERLVAERASAPSLSPFLQKLLSRRGGPPPPTA
jgi:flagellar biogenesis protein FliO